MLGLDRRISTTRAETAKIVQLSKATSEMETIQAISQGLKHLVGSSPTSQDLIALRYIEYLESTLGNGAASSGDGADALIKLQGLQTLRELGSGRGRDGRDI